MADLAGFMPQPGPGATYGGNWTQPQSGVMDTLASVLRAKSRRDFSHSPFGGDFLRRFSGNFSPIQNELDAPSAKTGQPVGPAEQARLISALQSEAEKGGQFMEQAIVNTGTSGTYAGPAMESNGSLQAQPYYQQLIAAAQGGADLPMIIGSQGEDPFNPGIDQVKQQDFRSRRADDIAGRQLKVQNKAAAKSDQRALRMGNMSEQEALLSALDRMQGGGDPFAKDAVMFGPAAAAARQENQMRQAALEQQAQFRNEQVALEERKRADDERRFDATQGLEREKLTTQTEQEKARLTAQGQQHTDVMGMKRDEMKSQGSPFERFIGGIVANAAANGQDLSSLLPQLMSIGQSMGMQGAPAGAMPQMPAIPTSAATVAAAADKATQFRDSGDAGAVLDTLGNLGTSSPDQVRQILMQTGMTPEDLRAFVADNPTFDYNYTPGPISFLPWLVAGENEKEYNARTRRQQTAKQLLQTLGQ